MKFKIFNWIITIQKQPKELFGAVVGWWYRFKGDPTDKVRILYYNRKHNPIRCHKCKKEIREGWVWDLYFVQLYCFNLPFDKVACTDCFPTLESVLEHYSKQES